MLGEPANPYVVGRTWPLSGDVSPHNDASFKRLELRVQSPLPVLLPAVDEDDLFWQSPLFWCPAT